MKRICQKFIEEGLAKEIEVDYEQIKRLLQKSRKCLRSAKILLQNNDEDASFELAYEAMLLAGRALFFSHNLRPRTIGSHKIVVNFVAEIMGAEFKTLAQIFDNMRRKRNYLIYGVGLETSGKEAENSLKNAQEFINQIEKLIQSKNPQKQLL
jgi:uncharacterized protein (UPF0332 family)